MNELMTVAQQIADLLLQSQRRIATAESCTGGWIAKTLTDLPGSSAWFDQGIVSYSNTAKMALLGVRRTTLQTHGSVSEAVVKAMAFDLLQHSGVDITVAVSGIAGPTGGTPEKPVGLVWFGWAGREFEVTARSRVFEGDREQVRRQAVHHALQGICTVCRGEPLGA